MITMSARAKGDHAADPTAGAREPAAAGTTPDARRREFIRALPRAAARRYHAEVVEERSRDGS